MYIPSMHARVPHSFDQVQINEYTLISLSTVNRNARQCASDPVPHQHKPFMCQQLQSPIIGRNPTTPMHRNAPRRPTKDLQKNPSNRHGADSNVVDRPRICSPTMWFEIGKRWDAQRPPPFRCSNNCNSVFTMDYADLTAFYCLKKKWTKMLYIYLYCWSIRHDFRLYFLKTHLEIHTHKKKTQNYILAHFYHVIETMLGSAPL